MLAPRRPVVDGPDTVRLVRDSRPTSAGSDRLETCSAGGTFPNGQKRYATSESNAVKPSAAPALLAKRGRHHRQ